MRTFKGFSVRKGSYEPDIKCLRMRSCVDLFKTDLERRDAPDLESHFICLIEQASRMWAELTGAAHQIASTGLGAL